MKVYQIMEYRNWEEHYSWGIYSTEEKAKEYLRLKGWDTYENFDIIEYVIDVNLNILNRG